MEIVVGKTAGFCFGVKNAVDVADRKLEEIKKIDENNKIYCLGEIVHNGQVIKKLENKGMITVDNIEEIPDNETVIFRAHGEAKKIYEIAKEKNLDIIDLTCKRVIQVHDIVEKHKEESYILILGKAKHPEIIGTKGFAEENSYVIENIEEVESALEKFKESNLKKIHVVAQTTFSSKYYDEILLKIEEVFKGYEISSNKTICAATETRQAETSKMAKDFHKIIIIGGKNSSNTKELVKVAISECENVYSIETVEELKGIDFDKNDRIGVMAGASTPKISIDEVVEFLEKI